MAASFIKKSDGNYYLRLTGDTNYLKFAAVSESDNAYTFSVAGTVYISKPNNDGLIQYYTTSATPVPSGGTLNDGRFPGTETVYFFSGSGIRDYVLSFSSTTGGTAFYLGGESLVWGGYAWPGDGYLNEQVAVGVKQSILSRETGTLRHIFDNENNTNILIDGTGATFVNQNPEAPDGIPCDPNNFNYSQKYYTVTWNTPFPNNNYTIDVTILDNQSAAGSQDGYISLCSIANKTASSFNIQFYATNVNGIGYVRSFSASGYYQPYWANAGNMFIKNEGSWKEVQTGWININGVWNKFFQNYGNSSWINMLENNDDPIDFGVQVIALNGLNNVFTSLDPNSSQFTRSLSVPSSITDTSWSSFMRTYAVWPYPGQINVATDYSSTWTINVAVAGNYILEVQADNSGQISFDNVVVASSISFTTSTIVNLNNVTAGTHTVTALVRNAPGSTDWNANPAGIAWKISPN